MKKTLEGVGGLLVFLGGCGVLRELTGWFDLMAATRLLTENVGFLEDRALFANIVIAVVGFALCMIGDSLK
ncbi:hypothetical protein [Streptomyces albipurpureus]|uniref:Integral membrane protein n=1 Tax=Streptomyces albipurpureus TaxID=2897419 RepID=A0ABT0V1F7_9ACTN|nr:hypothetical protein [Streptomyces sp. CWNU-1]MCM2394175.1 hypothetical protein [Streptomyces sp. CWNU-1]